jgi:hypothetical protein
VGHTLEIHYKRLKTLAPTRRYPLRVPPIPGSPLMHEIWPTLLLLCASCASARSRPSRCTLSRSTPLHLAALRRSTATVPCCTSALDGCRPSLCEPPAQPLPQLPATEESWRMVFCKLLPRIAQAIRSRSCV